jgi:hypothetical protein
MTHENPEHEQVRRKSDNGLFAWVDRRLSRTAKITTALATILASLGAGAGIVYKVDGIYVHSEVFAAEVTKLGERLDRTDLRALEGQLRSVSAQIFDLERQSRLTRAEIDFLNSLKSDAERIRREIKELRDKIQHGSK